MNISVIIPCINEASDIAGAVDSAWQAGAAEVIVVDGGSTDQTCDIAAGMNARLFNSLPGRGKQQHVGARQATGEVLLFLHADSRLTAVCIRQISRAMNGSKLKYGAFWQEIQNSGWQYRWLETGNAARVSLFGLAYGDQAIFIDRDFYFQLGGFPEAVLMEDVALMRRARKFSRPKLLPGPVLVSSRRWEARGVIKQSLINWSILCAFFLGVSPDRLARFYRRHDERKT